jgi:digeranylgeranylglycerophospholipid reductase
MSHEEPELQKKWDVVVIGAGPAGSSAAREAALGGCRSLLLERRKVVGEPVQCAEYLPMAVALRASQNSWAQKVVGMRTYVEARLVAENQWPGVVLHRERFDQELALEAVGAGVCLLKGAKVQRVGKGLVSFYNEKGLQEVEAPVLIGADGPLSGTALALGLRHKAFLYGLQVKAQLKSPMNHTEVHFWPTFRGGYGWVFPKGEWANVGLGVARSEAGRLPLLLGSFLEHLRHKGLIGSQLQGRPTGGLVPVGGPHPVTARGSILLAGDAAGHTDPITGGGIPNAILCGELAGRVASEALGSGDIRLLARYEERWRDLLMPTLERALGHRGRMEESWLKRPFEALVRSHWVAFRDYFLKGSEA